MTDEQHKKSNELAVEVFFGLARELEQVFGTDQEGDFKVKLIGEMYGRMLIAEWLGCNTQDIAVDAKAGIDRLVTEVEAFEGKE